MNEKTIRKKYYAYLVPSICSQVIFSAYILIDGIFVARGVSETALAAVNIAIPFVDLLWAISIAFAAGTSATAARLMGEGRLDEARRVFSRNICAMVILGAVISALVLIFLDPFCRFLGATSSTEDDLRSYVGAIAPFAMFFLVSYTLEILTATDGYPAKATRNLTVSVISNIVLDYLFIFVWDKGVWGAAIATSLAQILVIILYLLHFTSKKAHIRFCRFGSLKGSMRGLVKGLPSGINELSPGLVTFIFVHEIMKYLGESELVAYSATAYVTIIVVAVAIGVGQGAQPLVSFHNGRGEKSTIKLLLRYQLRSVACLVSIASAICVLFADKIIGVFLKSDAAILSYSVFVFKILLVSCIIAGANFVMGSYFTALEKPREGFIIAICRSAIMPFIGIEIAGHLIGPDGIWWGLAISELLSLLIAAGLYIASERKQ